jgi:hypothetical protein
LLWYLLLLAAVGIIIFAIWNYRRGTAARKAASESRFEKMFKAEAQLVPGLLPSSSSSADASASAKSAPAAPNVPPVAVERFLGKADALLYYLLKAGLPDAEVFAGVSLARVIGAGGEGRDREQQLRRLAQYQLDFVVCDKSMKILAVVELESAVGAGAMGDQRFKSDLLKQAGIRHVRINPAALPRREQVAALISGGLPAQGAP